jgi:hypothetical protein
MQQQFPRLAAGMCGENLAPQTAHFCEPWTQILRQLLVDLPAQALGHGGAFASGRNGNLQCAPADHGAKVKVAERRIVHTVDEDSALDSSLINGGIYIGGVRRSNHYKISVQVGALEGPLQPFDLFFDG